MAVGTHCCSKNLDPMILHALTVQVHWILNYAKMMIKCMGILETFWPFIFQFNVKKEPSKKNTCSGSQNPLATNSWSHLQYHRLVSQRGRKNFMVLILCGGNLAVLFTSAEIFDTTAVVSSLLLFYKSLLVGFSSQGKNTDWRCWAWDAKEDILTSDRRRNRKMDIATQ